MRHWHLTGQLKTLGSAVLIFIMGLQGCDSQPRKTESLIVAEAHQPAFGLIYIAQHQGYFLEESLQVSLQRHNSGRDALAAVVAGKADVATPFDTPVIANIQNQVPVRILSSLGLTNGYTQVIARKDMGIHQPADLRGKRIGTTVNSSADYLLTMVLANNGIESDQVERVSLSPPQMADALHQNQVDAVATWAPHTFATSTLIGIDNVTVFTSPAYLEFITLTTIESVLASRTEALKKLLRALVKANEFAHKEPQAALQIITDTLSDQDPVWVEKAWALIQPRIRLDNLLKSTLSGELKWFAAQTGQPDAVINLDSYLAPDVLNSVSPLAVTLSSTLSSPL